MARFSTVFTWSGLPNFLVILEHCRRLPKARFSTVFTGSDLLNLHLVYQLLLRLSLQNKVVRSGPHLQFVRSQLVRLTTSTTLTAAFCCCTMGPTMMCVPIVCSMCIRAFFFYQIPTFFAIHNIYNFCDSPPPSLVTTQSRPPSPGFPSEECGS